LNSVGGWYFFHEKWRFVFDIGTDTNADKSSSTNPAFAVAGLAWRF